VAGIIAARDNSIGTIGIAPGATLIGVKVLQGGSGSFGDVIDGILYAADPSSTPGKEGCARADIINMSLGATFIPEKGDKELLKALDKATTFADKHGVLVIAAGGNEGISLDQFKKAVSIPAMSARVLGVSATGPVGFALGATNFSRLASYSNFGKALVAFAAPGGDAVLPGNDLCQVAPIVAPCFVFDFVISPGTLAPDNTGYFFATGGGRGAHHREARWQHEARTGAGRAAAVCRRPRQAWLRRGLWSGVCERVQSRAVSWNCFSWPVGALTPFLLARSRDVGWLFGQARTPPAPRSTGPVQAATRANDHNPAITPS
jgi:hypothetical protein